MKQQKLLITAAALWLTALPTIAATDNQLAYQLVEELTVEIGPRLAGSPADAKAVAWASNKFKLLGYDKVWAEEFKTPFWQRGMARLEVTSPFPQSLVLTALGGSVGTDANGIDAGVVMFNSLDELMMAKPEQVRGKIVFINKAMQKDKLGSQYGTVVGARSKGAVEAARLGAKALLIRSVGTSSNRFAHTGKMSYEEGVAKIPAAAISVPDAIQLSKILSRAPEARLRLTMQTESQDAISHNVIAEITGSERPEEIVLISAHLDSWDQGTGALDDGAGVGIVMATGALLKQQGRPKRTVRVVLFGNEEGGLVGARAYAAKHAAELKNHVLASESDFGAGKIWQFETKFGAESLATATQIQQQLAPLGIALGGNKAYGGPDVSVLAALGVPVVSLEQDGTDYFDYHHTPNDTLDKINPADLEQNLQAWLLMTRAVADSATDFRK
ncbi:M20/M25/M40 family metallo-hydrolase [Rheinheimera sp. 4Y26]|uniref:M20/M25/M40 family metallo-hydrolase n=1 Tax=Rheinheimera sp. 4Y26 TaxID=2977811 RepID=UPI0021B13851|nr:M20/M25/M40 family metallo-hydrolase [Rheinheimera sp. 4Y26]MCT6698560.1 M20/M25/M40 family metallo-hydrolase [Rheinheimera sp. 4Y26]